MSTPHQPDSSDRGAAGGNETAADWLGPKGALEVQEQGRVAALAGEPVTACPWRTAASCSDRAARDMWVRGYAAGRTELRAQGAGTDAGE